MSKIQQIINNSNYSTTLFSAQEIDFLETQIYQKEGKDSFYIKCFVRDKEIILKPEEVVHQLYCYRLINQYNYPKERLVLEYAVNFGREVKRSDIMIKDKDNPNAAYIIIEVKKPNEKDGKGQLKSYAHATGSPINVWTKTFKTNMLLTNAF
jgi:type I restriction enzyme M protein